MGKRTLYSQDDLLRDKMKSMVEGSIKRARLEKGGEANITYEAFVDELDVGDSFTATLMDILVKEVADRRTRTNTEDRHKISERTAKSLNIQASHVNVYRDRHRPITRRYTAADYILPNPDIFHSEEDEDETAELLDAAEASRTSAASLYDAFSPVQFESYTDLRSSLSRIASAEPILDRETVTSPRPISPPAATTTLRVRHSHNPSGSSLARQNSIRRVARSRTTDFNDWASRRRSALRQQANQPETSVRAENSSDGTWRFGSLIDHPSLTGSTSRLGHTFLPMTAWSDPHLRINVDEEQWVHADPINNEPQVSSSSSREGQSSSQLWHTLMGRSSTSSSLAAELGAEEGSETQRPPRLRRGGLRAPEAMFQRFTPPFTDRSTPQPDLPPSDAAEPSGLREPDHLPVPVPRNSEWDALDEASRQLLTPRSISPAGEIFRL